MDSVWGRGPSPGPARVAPPPPQQPRPRPDLDPADQRHLRQAQAHQQQAAVRGHGGHGGGEPCSIMQLCITYHRLSAHAQVCLHSMHRYQPVVHITSHSPRHPLAATFAFPQTVFTTVTAYQNQQVGGDKRCESTLYSSAQITKLKIASNPFAKGFRESTRHTPSVQLPQPPGPAMVHSLHSLLALPHPYALYPPFRHPLLQYPKHGILQSVHYL